MPECLGKARPPAPGGETFRSGFFSTTQFVTLCLGWWWRKNLGVPYLIDIQDPWRTDYYEREDAPPPPGGWKYQFARFLAWILEAPVYQACSGFLSVSSHYLEDLCNRYSWFESKPCMVLHFGVSPLDIKTALARPSGPHHFLKKEDEIHLLYTGAAGPIMPHALNALFCGFQQYRAQEPRTATRFRFHFYGTSYVAPGCGWPSVMPVAESYGMAGVVDEIPHRLGHLESLSLQLHTDALILLGSSDPAYSPSKLYPYYLSGKPILAVVHTGSYLESLLQELNCAHTIPFAAEQESESVSQNFTRFFEWAASGFPSTESPKRNTELFNRHYLAEHLTAEQCRFWDQILKDPV
ncbi:MAG: glycosyltransferase family 4 protein [Blastochloris sp.]|nr:glycosyltransferase family 4 protein [Blastochloris sp.]